VLVGIDLPVHGRALALAAKAILDVTADVYAAELRNRPLPPLYTTNVQYRPEPNSGTGVEEWAAPWTVYERGWGDCDDLVLWRVAEIRAHGGWATVQVARQVNPDTGKFHIRVRHLDGREEDPSILLIRKDT
jgi:hypothetical protein